MSINDFTTVLKTIINRQPEFVATPAIGAVITTQDGDSTFSGTFAEMYADSFGQTWMLIVSAFEQRSIPASAFVWQYVWQVAS